MGLASSEVESTVQYSTVQYSTVQCKKHDSGRKKGREGKKGTRLGFLLGYSQYSQYSQ